jgi:hypothetical protein
MSSAETPGISDTASIGARLDCLLTDYSESRDLLEDPQMNLVRIAAESAIRQHLRKLSAVLPTDGPFTVPMGWPFWTGAAISDVRDVVRMVLGRWEAEERGSLLTKAELARLKGAARLFRGVAKGKPTRPVEPPRLMAIIDGDDCHFIVDGKPVPAETVGVHFVARLIRANGEKVSFAAFVRDNPQFRAARSDRVRGKVPDAVMEFIDWPAACGISASIRTERL